MKRFLLFLLLVLAHEPVKAFDLSFVNGTRIGTAGNSQTLAPEGAWSDYFCAYLALRHPQFTNSQFLNISRSGLGITGWFTNSDLIQGQTYDKLMYPWQPDIVIEQSVGAGGFSQAAWQSNLTVFINDYVVGESSAKPLIIGENPEGISGAGGPDGSTYTLGDMLVAQSYTPNKIVVTNWSTLSNLFGNPANFDALKVDPINDPSNLHMSKAANVITAWEVIRQLSLNANVSGFDTNGATATIDAATATVTTTNNGVVYNVSGDSTHLTGNWLNDFLPWAIDETGRHDATNIETRIIGWQNFRFTVTNLSPGLYSFLVGGTNVGIFSSVQFAAGVNRADFTAGPEWAQGLETLGKFRDMQGVDRVTQADLNDTTKGKTKFYSACRAAYEDNGKRGATLIADSSVQSALTSLTNLNAAIFTSAQPTPQAFEIIPFTSQPVPFR